MQKADTPAPCVAKWTAITILAMVVKWVIGYIEESFLYLHTIAVSRTTQNIQMLFKYFLRNICMSRFYIENQADNMARVFRYHYSDVKMGAMASQITGDCLLKRLFRGISQKTSKLRVTGLCKGNSPVTGEFPTQRENVSIWWRRHDSNGILGADESN